LSRTDARTELLLLREYACQEVFSSRKEIKRATIIYRSFCLLPGCAVCLTGRPDNVCDHYSLISSMSVSRSVLLLETELSLWLMLDYGTVCHMTS